MQVVFRNTFYEATGFGNAARQIAFAMEDAGVDVKIETMGSTYDFLDPVIVARLKKLEAKPSQERQVLLTLEPEPAGRERFVKTVSCIMWETSKLPGTLVASCNNHLDAVIVPNMFNRQAFLDAGVTIPIYTAPYGVDTTQYSPEGHRERLGYPDTEFMFLSVFGWSHRKGPDILLEAFVEEFNANDPVVLVIKTHGLKVDEFTQEWYDEALQTAAGTKRNLPKIRLVTDVMSPEQMAALYRGADCFVLPTRGEGVGLPIMENMACQTPVIATGWSGHMDFLNPNYSYLIPYHLVPAQPLHYTGLYQNDQLWAEPDTGTLQVLMRKVFMHQEAARAKAAAGREWIKNWNWNRSATAFISALEASVGQSIVP